MKRSNLRYCSIVSYVLIWVLFSCNLPEGAVVCFGADGHVDVEMADHARCQHSDQTDDFHDVFELERCTYPKHCEPCIDIALSIGEIEFLQMPQRNHVVLKSLTENLPTSIIEDTVLLVRESFQPSITAVNPSLASLRSVILLS